MDCHRFVFFSSLLSTDWWSGWVGRFSFSLALITICHATMFSKGRERVKWASVWLLVNYADEKPNKYLCKRKDFPWFDYISYWLYIRFWTYYMLSAWSKMLKSKIWLGNSELIAHASTGLLNFGGTTEEEEGGFQVGFRCHDECQGFDIVMKEF